MTSKTILFLGGSSDGRRSVVYPIGGKLPRALKLRTSVEGLADTYHLYALPGELFVYTSLVRTPSLTQIMERLIEGYAPPENPS